MRIYRIAKLYDSRIPESDYSAIYSICQNLDKQQIEMVADRYNVPISVIVEIVKDYALEMPQEKGKSIYRHHQEDIKEILRLFFEEGKKASEIAKLFGFSDYAIEGIIHRNKKKFGYGQKARNYSDEDIKEILRLYFEEGKTGIQIAKLYGLSDYTINNIIYKNKETFGYGQKTRNYSYSDEDIKEILRLYFEEDKTVIQIAALYELLDYVIENIIHRNKDRFGYGRKTFSYTEDDIREILRLYFEEGKKALAISGLYNVSEDAIYHIIHKNRNKFGYGQKTRNYLYSDENIEKILRLYFEEDKTGIQIAKLYGVNQGVIENIIHRNKKRFGYVNKHRQLEEVAQSSNWYKRSQSS